MTGDAAGGPPPDWLGAAWGRPVLAATQARWGFRHETWIVTAHDGERAVVQRRADGSDPTLPPHPAIRTAVRVAGLPVPEPVRAAASLPGMVVVLPFVEGDAAADLLARGRDAGLAGRICGMVAARFRSIPTEALPTGTGGTGLDPTAPLPVEIPGFLGDDLERYLRQVAPVLTARPLVPSHGDLAPVNILVRGGRIAAVLDLERARLAHADYDAAWFAWVVGTHHPGLARAAWHGFADAARMAGRRPRDVSWLWPYQLLERVVESVTDEERTLWTGRLAASLAERPTSSAGARRG